MRRCLPVVALVVLFAGVVPSVGSAQPRGLGYGAAAFILGSPETTARDITLMQQAGLNWLRLDVPWRSIEFSCKGCLDWTDLDRSVSAATAAGINVMIRVDRSPPWARAVPAENGPPDNMLDYADFIRQLAERYRTGSPLGTARAIQVWNEPNLDREWGGAIIDQVQAGQYAYMLREAYRAIKAVDPAITVVSAGLSPTGTNDGTAQPDDVYLDWLYREEFARYADVVGMHAPGYGSPPEAELNSDPRFPHPSFYFRRVEQLRGIMEAYGDGAKQAWILEFGWTTDQVNPQYSWYAVTPEQQADYIVRGYQYANQRWPWVGVMFVWNMANSNWTPDYEQYWWSIIEPDGTPRPAYSALAAARSGGVLP